MGAVYLSNMAEQISAKRVVGATWGIIGVTLILSSAILRVSPKAADAFRVGLSPTQWIILVVWVVLMLVGEGYRGFQLNFAPRVAARMWYLSKHGSARDLWLAPLFCVGYYGASRRRIISSWSLTVVVTLIIVVVAHIAQPWRGIIDFGVAAGLIYGLICVFYSVWQTVRSKRYLVKPDVLLNPSL